jgi:hypothetical protein
MYRMVEAYPLHWPLNKRRTAKESRNRSNFSTQVSGGYGRRMVTMAEAISRVKSELDKYSRVGKPYRVPPSSVVISTNVPVKKDGLPYSGMAQPEDTGAAVYFKLDGKDYCLPCDKWDRVEDNLAAIAAHISAMRGIERWGVGESHDVYTGFAALPESTEAERNIWDVLGLSVKPDNIEAVKKAYRERANVCHPDKPTGSHQSFTELQNAYEKALKFYQ